MALEVVCPQGHRLKLREQFAGRRVKCPRCGEPFLAQPAEEAEVIDDWEETKVEPAPRRPKESRPDRGGRSSSRKRPAPSSSNSVVIVAVGAALGGVLLIVVLAALLFRPSRTQPIAQSPPSQPIPASPAGAASPAPLPPGTRPQPPLTLNRPEPPAAMWGDVDLRKEEPDALKFTAREAVQKRDYPAAVQLQYWAVVNAQEKTGHYDLACYYSQVGNVEAALYWLQRATAEEGVDGDWAGQDGDLVRVRADGRWPAMRQFIQQYNDYWTMSGVTEISLLVPAGYTPGTAIPLVIGLHGMGHRARGFIDEDMQPLADQLQMALLAVSGTVPRGPSTFVWSEDPDRDFQRVEAALAEIKDRVTIAPGKIVLYGFSQGAMVSAELAARHPDRFTGAIALSPGGHSDVRLSAVTPQAAHQPQGYVALCGGGEHPGNVQNTRDVAAGAEKLQARTYLRIDPAQQQHTFPSDFATGFPRWVRFVLDPQSKQPEL